MGEIQSDVLNTFKNALAAVIGREKYVIIATVIYLVLFFAFASGLVNSMIEGSSARALVVPSRSIQSIGETIVTSIIFFLGFFGVYLLYESGRAMTVKKQWVFLVGGIVAIFVSIVLGLNLVRLKS